MRLKETVGISITNNEKTLWSRHADSCNMKLSAWISLMIHLGINKNLDQDFQRHTPTPLPREAVLPAPPQTQVLDTRPQTPYRKPSVRKPYVPVPASAYTNPPPPSTPERDGFTLEQWRGTGNSEDYIQQVFGEDYKPPS